MVYIQLLQEERVSKMNITSFRDLTLIDINDDNFLVISCDSCGGVGEKSADIVKTSADIVGYYTAKVSLAEILAIGAKPLTVVDTLSVEMDDTGNKILIGIKKALKEIGITENIVVTGSTEENFPTIQTGIGITAIGMIHKDNFRRDIPTKGSKILVAGIPLVGDDLLNNEDKSINLKDILEFRNNPNILEILPVGSKGILQELKLMARDANLKFILEKEIEIDINKSAGPSSCVLLAVKSEGVEDIMNKSNIPINLIGSFVDMKNDIS